MDSGKNLLGHPSESIIDFLISIVIDFDVLLLSWIFSSLKESLETIRKSLFPEELLIFVLLNELSGGLFNIVEVVCESLHGSIDDVLILDLNQVITHSCIKSDNLNSKRDEIINDTLENIFDTVFFGVWSNTWIKDNFSIDEINSDVENWWMSVMLIVSDVNLVGQEAH